MSTPIQLIIIGAYQLQEIQHGRLQRHMLYSRLIAYTRVLLLPVPFRGEDLSNKFALASVPRGSHPFVRRLRKVVLGVNSHATYDPNACEKSFSTEEC